MTTTETIPNGLDDLPAKVKEEKVDDLPLEAPVNGVAGEENPDLGNIHYFTQIEVDNTRKCLENTRLVIKDFETQLDWHLQQYMILKNICQPKSGSRESRRQEMLSIANLTALINSGGANMNFFKRKGKHSNGASGEKRSRNEDEEDEDMEEEEDSEEYSEDEEDYYDSEDMDDPSMSGKKNKKKANRRSATVTSETDDSMVVPKEEIDEEVHELIVPKEERMSDEDEDEDEEEDEDEDEEEEEDYNPGRKSPKKKPAATPKKSPKKTPAKGCSE